jgi:hypothetical protein
LIGAERERRKRGRATPAAAGLRTFAVGAPAGALSLQVRGVPRLAIVTAFAGILMTMSCWRLRSTVSSPQW